MSKQKLFAVQQLVGGTPDDPHITAAGTEITEAEAEALGIGESDLLKLMATGAVEMRGDRAAARAELDELDLTPGAISEPDDFDGVDRADFEDFLERHGFEFEAGADIGELLKAESPAFDGIASDALRAKVRALRADIADDAGIDEMLVELAAVGRGDQVDEAARTIDREMKADDIRAELGKLKVPFETDANKPALARLLAQVREPAPAPATGGTDDAGGAADTEG